MEQELRARLESTQIRALWGKQLAFRCAIFALRVEIDQEQVSGEWLSYSTHERASFQMPIDVFRDSYHSAEREGPKLRGSCHWL